MKTVLAIFLVSILACGTASAKSAGDCHQELKAICKDKMGNDKFECMRSGVETLDEECKKMITAGKEKFMAGKGHPCMAEREKCKDAGGGHEKVMKCLMEKRAELSDACKKHLDEKVKEHPCLEDRMKFCADVQPGEGRIIKCLKDNKDKLSEACKAKAEKENKDDALSAE